MIFIKKKQFFLGLNKREKNGFSLLAALVILAMLSTICLFSINLANNRYHKALDDSHYLEAKHETENIFNEILLKLKNNEEVEGIIKKKDLLQKIDISREERNEREVFKIFVETILKDKYEYSKKINLERIRISLPIIAKEFIFTELDLGRRKKDGIYKGNMILLEENQEISSLSFKGLLLCSGNIILKDCLVEGNLIANGNITLLNSKVKGNVFAYNCENTESEVEGLCEIFKAGEKSLYENIILLTRGF